jgi:hypothetical protein
VVVVVEIRRKESEKTTFLNAKNPCNPEPIKKEKKGAKKKPPRAVKE